MVWSFLADGDDCASPDPLVFTMLVKKKIAELVKNIMFDKLLCDKSSPIIPGRNRTTEAIMFNFSFGVAFSIVIIFLTSFFMWELLNDKVRLVFLVHKLFHFMIDQKPARYLLSFGVCFHNMS